MRRSFERNEELGRQIWIQLRGGPVIYIRGGPLQPRAMTFNVTFNERTQKPPKQDFTTQPILCRKITAPIVSGVRGGPVEASLVTDVDCINVSWCRPDGIKEATSALSRRFPTDYILSEEYNSDFGLSVSGKRFHRESLEEGMRREMEEEIGLSCNLGDLEIIRVNTNRRGVTTTIYRISARLLVQFQPVVAARGVDDTTNKVSVLIHGTKDEIRTAMESIQHIRNSTDDNIVGVVGVPLCDIARLASIHTY